MKKTARLIFGAFLMFWSNAFSQTITPITFENYCNQRYGFCVDYPKNIIYPQPESTNGDGRVFKNKLGEEVLRVFGQRTDNPLGGVFSLAEQYDQDLQKINISHNSVITYQKRGSDFFVISGYRQVLESGQKRQMIFYQKTILRENSFCYAQIQYNESQKQSIIK